jgi:hypothetical protein
MTTIWKFPIPIRDDISIIMPVGARVLHVGCQLGHPCMWATVDPDAPPAARNFRVLGTGHRFRGDERQHVGTFQQGTFVWHLFETDPGPHANPAG